MKLRLTLLVVSLAMAVQAQMQMNVQQLADFVRSELALRQHSDKQIAAYIKKLELSEKLTDKTITDLESQGAGPKTVEALQELRNKTASMRPPAHDSTYSPATAADNTLKSGPATVTLSSKAPPIPPPDSVRQQKILDLMKQYAMSYTENLPNFICVQVTRQYVDPYAGDHYRSIGNILAKVSYNEGREKYNVYSVNGQLINTSMEGVPMHGGAISTGEFGSLMREIFEPHSQAEFGWDHWATLRGRRMAVFKYFIDSGHSSWSISYSAGPGDEQRIITAYNGLVYADENTGEIDRIKFVAVDIPRSFPVTEATEILDYDAVDISGQRYICPLVARLFMRADRQSSKNEIEFRDYRKFGTESNITYDLDPNAPPPLPANKTEEQPASHGSADSATPAQAARPQQPAKPQQKSESGSNPWTLPTPPPPPPQQ
ncbi:MAG TPA: hypothetical protein VH601_09420 [Bryobacteraceae bacterium]